MTRYCWLSALIAAGCAKTPCEGDDLFRAEDGNCYALDDGGPTHETWLVDMGVSANVQDRFRRNRGTAAADFDGDGRIDFYLANPNDPATLLLNADDGVFVEQTDAPTTGNDAAVAAADYDNDGDPDLWVACGGWGEACTDALYRNDGINEETGRIIWTDVSTEAGLTADPRQGFGVAWGDYNNDGLLDAFISNKRDWSHGVASAANQLYRNNGDGSFDEVGEEAGVAAPLDNHTASWLDVEPDGDLDLFVPTLFGDNLLYINQGDGSFSEAGPTALSAPYQAFGSTAFDGNNDGLVDLMVTANSGSGWAPEDIGDEPTLFVNQGDGDFVGFGLSELLGVDLPVQMRVMGFAAGDLNMDGFTDFFFGNGEPVTGGMNRLVVSRQEDDGSVTMVDLSADIDSEAPEDDGAEPYRPYPYRTHGTVMVDVDNDLDLDLYVGNGGMNMIPDKEEPNRLFVSSKSETVSAISVSLRGHRSNRDGVGSMITVESTDGDDVTRWVSRSSGFNSSIPRIQVIGLGSRTGPFDVHIAWPSGAVQTISEVVSGTQLDVDEPAD
jgi:hypothetical protein